VVAFSSQTGLSNPLKSGAGDLQALFLPIASSVLLIGMTDGAPIVSDDEINMASSKLSRHFFIASSDGPEQAAYLPFLGEQSAVVDEATMREWFREVMDQRRRPE
jgi:hypothetical protein